MADALREKDALLKEIHHRVKNNLQVTSGLLLLQSQHARDDDTRQLFFETMNRVKSMALVHTKLYESPDLAAIDLGEYVRDLTADLMHAYGARERGIALDVSTIPPVKLDLDTAVNCGLIINEVVVNAIKHAFPDGRSGTIRILLERADEHHYRLDVVDDGVGIPPAVDPARSTSLGYRLVQGLAKQLDGSVAIVGGPGGTRVSVTFLIPAQDREKLKAEIP
jgi:two-component sensor histidine kinase